MHDDDSAEARLLWVLNREIGLFRSCGQSGQAEMREYIREHGRFMPGAARPKGVRKGLNRLCFTNACRLALDRADLTYCEGFASALPRFEEQLHAWVVAGDGTVVDPTWPHEDALYYGLPIPTPGLARAAAVTDGYGPVLQAVFVRDSLDLADLQIPDRA